MKSKSNIFTQIAPLTKGKLLFALRIYLFILSGLLIIGIAKGEGTKELTPTATDNGYLNILDNGAGGMGRPFASYIDNDSSRLYISVCNPGEKIYFGFNIPSGFGGGGSGTTYFRIKDPLGNIVFGPMLVPTTPGAGYINTYAEAVAGPNTLAAGGYNPLVFTPTTTGNYYIEFNPGDPTIFSYGKRVFQWFDITVGNSANQAIKGRLWSKGWDLNTLSYSNEFKGIMYVYSNDGILTSVNFNGMQPYGFVICANQTGCTNTGNFQKDRMSLKGNITYSDYKLFLNPPDTTCFPIGSYGKLTAPTTVTGCSNDDLCINLSVSKAGRVEIILDLNGIAGYQPNTADLDITQDVVAGVNCIHWDGKDGLGNAVSQGTKISFIVNYYNGLTNMPLYDVEFHQNGYIVNVVKPNASKPALFWDDSNVGGTKNIIGCTVTTGCHSWPNPDPTGNGGFGNLRTINTWWYANLLNDNFSYIFDYITVSANRYRVKGAPGGNDTTVCAANKSVPLHGKVTYATGGKWTTNGNGTFLPNDTMIDAEYIFSPADIAKGSVLLTLSSTGNKGCKPGSDSMLVTIIKSPLVQAGPDQTICNNSSSVKLNGSVSFAGGGIWSGGNGTYTISDTSMSTSYIPTSKEIASGIIKLKLTSTGNNVCPAVSDTVNIRVSSLTITSLNIKNVSCFGNSDGWVNITVSGGIAPYSYSWNTNPVQNIQTAIKLPAGNYSVTASDAIGCSATSSAIITQPDQLITTIISTQNINCKNGNNGQIATGTTGGITPYSYTWNTTPVQKSASAINLIAGIYSLTVTDQNGCSTTVTSEIKEPALSLTANIINSNNVLCKGGNTGNATVTANGGTIPYTYKWNTNPVQSSTTASNLKAGNYSITVTDINGCTATNNIAITEPTAPLSVSVISSGNVNCKGGNNGKINMNVSGGTTPYIYSWNTSPVQTSLNATNLPAGTYSLTITDKNGCSVVSPKVTITEPALSLTADINNSKNVLCKGDNTGNATVTANGGTIPYTYKWNTNPVQSSTTASNLKAGNYSVTVTDINECSATDNITITEPATPLSVSFISSVNVNCKGDNNGKINMNVSGGTAPYSYSWNTSPVQTTLNATNLSTGTYSLTITDKNGCSVVSPKVTITEPALSLTANISNSNNVLCKGGNTGNATVTANGGTIPYTYKWNTNPVQSSTTAFNLKAGNYSVTVTDINGCTATDNIAVTEPAAPLSVSVISSVNVNCKGDNNGKINMNVSGGTAPYSYSWNTSPVQTTLNATNLSTGTYSLTITDKNGCSATDNITITEPAAPLSVSVISSVNVNCKGDNNGKINMNVSGGTTPYIYSWNTSPVQTTLNATNLPAGTYSLTITDKNGCSVVSPKVTITEPAMSLTANISNSKNVLCKGGNTGNATVTANGGTIPYTYKWNTNPVQSSTTASNLKAGNYSVTVTDINGCTATDNITITEPAAPLSVSVISSVNVNCRGGNNGKINMNVSGGTAPYSYSWNTSPVQTTLNANNLPAGTYSLTITDKNGCSVVSPKVTITEPAQTLTAKTTVINDVLCNGANNGQATANAFGGTGIYTYQWSNFATTQTISNLSAGRYILTVTDANNCSDTESVIINQPTPLILNSTKTNVKCYDQNTGEIDLIVAGGIAPYNYQWSNKSTTKDQVNLPAGDYTVTVTDANGCLTTGNITINQPGYPALTVIPITTDIICYGDMTGAISLNVFGGTKPYQFMWSNGMKDQNISGLPAGLFNVTVIDGNGCTTDTSATLIQSPAPIVTSYNKTDAKCYGSYDGSISLNVTGGFTPYFYKWSDGKTSANINSLNSDNYTVTVTDAKGCIRNKTINISQPDSLSLSFKTFDVNCYGDITGNINLDVSGGTAPYNYIWSNGKTSQDINKLSAGYYRVTVTDNNNCIKIGSANIKEPLPLDAFADKKDIKCHGQKTGAIYLTPTGGTSPYYYRWSSNNATSQNLIDVAAGNYTVTITDSKYCNKNKNYSITVPDTMTAMISKTDNKCFGDSTGWAHVSVSGGAGQYKYSWNTIPPDTSDIISNLNSGNYSVTVTDKNNCSVVTSVAIISPQPLVINASGDMKVCSNASTELVAIASGGTAPYGYHWNNRPDNIQKQSIKPTSDTTYTVFAKDANNCLSGTKAINITLYKPIILKLSITSGQNTLCYGTKVDLNANATGGKGNYSYSWSTGAKGNVSTISVFPTSKTLYFVTVTDNCTTPVVDSVLINVYPQTPVSFIPDDFTGCPPLFVRFTNKTEHILSCSWNFGDPQSGKDNFSDSLSASHIYYNHGSYNVTLSVIDSNGCKSSSTIYNLVKVISKPTANFKIEPEEIDMNNPDVHFTDLSNDAFKWLWNFGDNYGKGKGNSSTIQNPAHQYSKAGSYLVHLTVYNGSGCEDTIVKSIKIKEVYKFYIPNSFTPNGDGTNDFFIPVGNAIVTGYFELYIFNRWGQQIFYTNDTNNPWNGRYHGTGEIVQDGVYVWMLILKNKDAAKETHYGNVNLYH